MRELEFIETALVAAGAKILEVKLAAGSSPLAMQTKTDTSLVTAADLASEESLLGTLGEQFPEDIVWSEEAGLGSAVAEPGRYIWIVDPLDGTTNFFHGHRHYCISIARGRFGLNGAIEMVAGGIYQPEMNELYLGTKTRATMNGKRLRIPKSSVGLGEALISVGLSYHRGRQLRKDCHRLESIANVSRSLRISGSCALDMAYVAAGQFEGFVEVGVKAWDMAAGALIIEGAGGVVRSFNGTSYGPFDPYVEGVLCGRPEVVAELIQLLGVEEMGTPLGRPDSPGLAMRHSRSQQ